MPSQFGDGRDVIDDARDQARPEHPGRIPTPSLGVLGLQDMKQRLGRQGLEHGQQPVVAVQPEKVVEGKQRNLYTVHGRYLLPG